jgi:hypothetical protein
LGNYFNNLLDFFLPILNAPDYNLDFKINHLAAFGKKIHSDSKAGLNFNKDFSNFTIFAGAGGGYEFFNYYGQSYLKGEAFTDNKTFDNSRETLLRLNAFAGVHSARDSENWRYSGQLKFNRLQAYNGLSESVFSLPLNLDFVYNDHRAGINFTFNYLQYASTADTALSVPFKAYSPAVISPYYRYDGGALKAHLGVTLGISIGQGQLFTFAPDAYVEWMAIPHWLALYGGAGGGLDINTLDKTYAENRYILPSLRLEDTYTPLKIYAGVKIKPFTGALIDVFAAYRYVENQYFFVNQQMDTIAANRFTAEYSRASQVKFGIRLGMNFNETVNLQAKLAYNKWFLAKQENEALAWHLPAVEADFGANVHVTQDITISANAFYQGKRTAKIQNKPVTMNPAIDINLGGTYAYANWLSFFIKANNLLNSKYDTYLGYRVQGINIMLGASLSF